MVKALTYCPGHDNKLTIYRFFVKQFSPIDIVPSLVLDYSLWQVMR